MKTSNSPSDEVCTTQKAAEMLGISVTSVQQLVEAGVIEAWKTKGGHRRIPLAAIHAYKASSGAQGQGGAAAEPGEPSVLIIEDNPMQRALYERNLAQWGLPLNVRLCDNGYQALIEISRYRPDILLADIVMEGMDGYEVIKTILGYPELADIHIAILSSMSLQDLEKRGGIPPGVVFFQKPVNPDELRGYLRACIAQKLRN
ncbi:response regulator [Massilia endophytica]|uniref:response regulator n=1 Tax=Massilia endophytica TaxID=2899220 RepID=UPI001E59DBAE|nr:response regulator [Massilia endophytica]UGQ47219.1 response regulator [Massilia endophytica]